MYSNKNCLPMFYNGNVEVEIKVGGKFYKMSNHNEGLPHLKYLFSKFLAGNISDNLQDVESMLPKHIDLIMYEAGADADVDGGNSFLSSILNAQGKTYQDALGYYTEFKTFISSDMMADVVNVDDSRKFYLYLLTGLDTAVGKRYRLARVPIDVKLLAKITPGTTGSVTWRMRLLNGGEIE